MRLGSLFSSVRPHGDHWRRDAHAADEAHLDTVGRALQGQEIKVLPPAEEGLDGEIAIRGPVVMHGYYNRLDTNRALSPDGWFFTGDLGRLDERGRLTITGRKKDVIVLANGKKIYPEEVRFGEPLRFEAAADYGESANRLRNAVDEMWTVI